MLIHVKIFMGGTLNLLPKLHYVDTVEENFFIEHDVLTLDGIHTRVREAGYHSNAVHLEAKYPWQDIEEGGRGLRKEKHLKRVIADMLVNCEDTLEVYVDHGVNTPTLVINLDSSDEEVKGDENENEDGIRVVPLLLPYVDGENCEAVRNDDDVEVESCGDDRGEDGVNNEAVGDGDVLVESCDDSDREVNDKNEEIHPNRGDAATLNSEDGPGAGARPNAETNELDDRPEIYLNGDARSSAEEFSDFADSEDDDEMREGFEMETEELGEEFARASVGVGGPNVGAEQGRFNRVNRPTFGPGMPEVETDEEGSDILDSPPCSDSEDEIARRKKKLPVFNESSDMKGPIKLEVGMLFSSIAVFRKALKLYSLQIGHDYRYVKNEKSRVTVTCKKGCSWRLHASPSADRTSFQIKTFRSTHYCGKDVDHSKASVKWIAETYLADFKDNIDIDLSVLASRVRREQHVIVSMAKMARAKKLAENMIEGEHEEQYRLLWNYAEAIRKSNPGSTVKISAPRGVFKRLYMCLAACKRGFLKGCRPFIGIDGCHLKGKHKGHLLSAVGKDANGNLFPIAWAVVDSECKDNWLWFLKRLEEDIGQLDGWCFMSDRQKGLQNIFDTVLKDVDHRYCVRHIWVNFKSEFGGSQYLKDQVWEAAKAYTINKFNIHLEKIKCESPAAFAWLKRIPPARWSRHAFKPWVMCDLLLNNLSESFNAYIRLARRKPILTCLESIRCLLMKRFYVKYQGMLLYEGKICPRWFNRLEKSIQDCQSFLVYPNSQLQQFEIEHISGERCICDLQAKTCSCRRWDLTGVPCRHATAAIMFIQKNPHDYVHVAYHKSTFLEAYKDGILPVADKSEWPVMHGHYDVRPSARTTQPGRPRHKRRREAGETGPSNPIRATRAGLVMTCRNCRAKSHNTRTCPLPMRSDIPPLRKKKKRTPNATPVEGDRGSQHVVQENNGNANATEGRFSRTTTPMDTPTPPPMPTPTPPSMP